MWSVKLNGLHRKTAVLRKQNVNFLLTHTVHGYCAVPTGNQTSMGGGGLGYRQVLNETLFTCTCTCTYTCTYTCTCTCTCTYTCN